MFIPEPQKLRTIQKASLQNQKNILTNGKQGFLTWQVIRSRICIHFSIQMLLI
jgi:hypothetical protein